MLQHRRLVRVPARAVKLRAGVVSTVVEEKVHSQVEIVAHSVRELFPSEVVPGATKHRRTMDNPVKSWTTVQEIVQHQPPMKVHAI